MDVERDVTVDVISALESTRDGVFINPPVVFGFKPSGMLRLKCELPLNIIIIINSHLYGCSKIVVIEINKFHLQ